MHSVPCGVLFLAAAGTARASVDAMSTQVRSTVEPVAREEPTARPFGARHWGALLAAIVITFLIAVALWPAGPAGERRALLRMPPEARRELYDETRRNADALCAQAPRERALLERCADSAEFLREFPECDADCRAFARAHGHGPTR
jgi:hypothetical protein